MKKIAESLNRVFLVTFQNGQQVIARIPTLISGPPHYTTASEVAAMDFLRRLGMPVPKVVAWSSRAQETEVESEFIIMEKVKGEPLTPIWDTVDHEVRTLFTSYLSCIVRYWTCISRIMEASITRATLMLLTDQ